MIFENPLSPFTNKRACIYKKPRDMVFHFRTIFTLVSLNKYIYNAKKYGANTQFTSLKYKKMNKKPEIGSENAFRHSLKLKSFDFCLIQI